MQPPCSASCACSPRPRWIPHHLLTVVLAGDQRLLERFAPRELLPLGSRMRVRLALERATPEELRRVLHHALAKAGAPKLMTPELMATLCDHAQGNYAPS